MDNYVITIARGYGSGGKEIGTKLASELGIPCYDSEILARAAKKSGIDEKLFEEYDEKTKRTFLKRKVYNWALGVSEEDDEKIDGYKLFQLQAEVMREIARTESCVIIGKCADYILRDLPNVVSFYVEAPRWACLKRLTSHHGWSADQANDMLIRMERQRSEYYRVYSGGQEWTNPTNYDLTINSARMGIDGSVAIIRGCLDYRMKNMEGEKE